MRNLKAVVQRIVLVSGVCALGTALLVRPAHATSYLVAYPGVVECDAPVSPRPC